MPRHSFNTLMRRLAHSGFRKQFVSTALMPDWWEESYAQDSTVLPEVEIRIARFLNVPLSVVRDAETELAPPVYGDAQLRRVRDIDRGRLGPAIHTAMRVAEAVIRNLRCTQSKPSQLPDNALEWRRILRSRSSGPVQLDDILCALWANGIPVIPIDTLPAPGFQGLACIVDGHPTIVLGQKYDEPSHVAFIVAHEAGHIASGHCSLRMLVVDQDKDIRDGSEVERAADCFAKRLLVGDETVTIPVQEQLDAKSLAERAVDLESEYGVDAGSLIFTWAASTLNYPAASLAVRALYRSTGARRQMRQLFDRYIDSGSASESDRTLLRCVYGGTEPPAATA